MVTAVKILVKLIKIMIVFLKIETGPLAPLVDRLEEIIRQHEAEKETTTETAIEGSTDTIV